LLADHVGDDRQRVLYAVLTLGVFVFWYAMLATNRVMRKAARRLREIERSVNRRAGERLLQWESYWGGAVTGFWGKGEPLPGRPREDDLD
jgi:hypothetical protein